MLRLLRIVGYELPDLGHGSGQPTSRAQMGLASFNPAVKDQVGLCPVEVLNWLSLNRPPANSVNEVTDPLDVWMSSV